MTEPGQPPRGPNHALLVGTLVGLCMKEFGRVTILDTPDGVHTDEFLIRRPSGTWRIKVSPEDVPEEDL